MSDYNSIDEKNYPVQDYGSSSMKRFEFEWEETGNGGLQGSFTSIHPIDPNTSWLRRYWRPAIAWQYFAVCLFDFLFAPLAVMALSYYTGQEYNQWQPLTLVAGGFYHIAMGAIIGVAAYGRTKEKMVGVDAE